MAQPSGQPDAPIHGFYLASVGAARRLAYSLGVKGSDGGMMIGYFASLGMALAVGILAAPVAVDAQSTTKVPRIGYLSSGSSNSGFHEQFGQGLRELGWVEGQNIAIDYRFADGGSISIAK